MTERRVDGAEGGDLHLLHERLHRHFTELHSRRADAATPIFALEHGLSEAELLLLKAHVCSAVSHDRIPHESWLPLVVYAAEVGYEYSGDEYWQTFEARTPGWAQHGDRQYIRGRFRDFRDAFGGAQPTGAWAQHFSIICWPITHAVLPTDLQRHLARLMFEYRRALTSDLLSDPDELGKHLAARSWQASSRFQNFAQNTGLLGRVAAALLVGEEESPFLLDATLRRIVNDLSKERDARRWLRDAKSSAARVRTRGLRTPEKAPGERSGAGPSVALAPAADPELSLRREDEGWTAYAELPDLSVLVERFPQLGEELRGRRALFTGAAGAPLARGRLLYPGQRLRLSEWPPADVPLLQVEGGSAATNSLLSDQSVLSPGPLWVFRMRDTALASEVRGKFLRPAHRYVLLSEDALPRDLPPWIDGTACTTGGVHAYTVDVPPVLGPEDLEALRTLELGTVSDVEVRPAGFVPAMWDGEGRAEWLAGESPMLAVSTTRVAGQSVWVLDNEPQVIPWPTGERQVFVRFDDLGVGTHHLDVSLLAPNLDQPMAEGVFEILIRPPHSRPTSGTFREGLMMLATPVTPTLTELWDGRALVEVRGPADVQVAVEAVLADRLGSVLARRRATTTLPVDAENWTRLFTDLLRRNKDVQRVYDDAERCLISVGHEQLGTVSLRCEREFSPLRWAVAQDRDGPLLRLIDHTEGVAVKVELFEFARPDRPVELQLDGRSDVRSKPGGLAIATAGSATAAMILPPRVQQLEDLYLAPQLSDRARSLPSVLDLVHLAELWAGASLPSDPFGENARIKALRAISAELAGLIGGQRWAHLESRFAAYDTTVTTTDLLEAIGDAQYQRALAREVGRWIDALRPAQAQERAELLAELLAKHARTAGVRGEDHLLAEFLLRLASEPASLARWPSEDLEAQLTLTLNSPVLLRAARSMVLAIDTLEVPSVSATHGGWAWQ